MTLVKVYVTYKKSILDPQGETIKKAVHGMGHTSIQNVRMGKYFELTLSDNAQNIDTEINEVCDQLLANPNMESYRYEVMEEDK